MRSATTSEGDQHRDLYRDVRDAIASLPTYFRTETRISGILATDLHTLNTVLGATIEEQVISTLNQIRSTWDPNGQYALYRFVRQAQTFPDVLLRRASDNDILLGIELKGWYLLAKEREPSLRFQVTEAACAEQDLIVVVPWVLDNVVSGSPTVFEPFVTPAKAAAKHRNHHWQHVRDASSDIEIQEPDDVAPYPRKTDQILDKPASDDGGNFGRLARTGIMDDYTKRLDEVPLCGIKTTHWRDFLRTFPEGTDDAQARAKLRRLAERTRTEGRTNETATAALAIVTELKRLLDSS